MNHLHLRVGNVSVYLRRIKVLMTEETPDYANIYTAVKQISRKRVSESVRVNAVKLVAHHTSTLEDIADGGRT